MVLHEIIERENCSQLSQGVYTKDLRIIQNRKLENLILVDNSTYSFILQLQNGIPCIPFYNNKNDKELYKLRDMMINLANETDPRVYLTSLFQWENCLKYSQNASKLLNMIFT